ncbi:B12-binding domain-containing radical SAM protein [bacterium]|nr:B12-binding domain-containing radical SAM protein [bacterium]
MNKSIDLLLINAKSRDVLPGYLPYGLLWIAAVVRKEGYEVRIYDRNVEKVNPKKILNRYQPKVVGISCLTGPVIDDAIETSRCIKRESQKIPIVWGGLHPTIFPYHVLKKEYVDYIIAGEGEYPVLELLGHLLKKEGKLEEIRNLGYKEKEGIRLNPQRDFIDLNKLPLPAWDLVSMKKYYQSKFYANRIVTLNTSRGCSFRCTFCYNQAVNRRKWRGMSAEKIIEHIKFLRSRYSIHGFQIYDDDFDANKKRLIKFCNLLLKEKEKILWQHFSRVNYARADILRLEKEAGCQLIEYGVESGSQRILNFIQKDQTVFQTKEAFDICKRINFSSSALFMIGLPTETREDVNKTVSLVDSLDAFQTICTIYRPYPGTKLYDYCAQKNLFQLPDELEEQGKIYSIGDTELNLSRIPTNYLKEIHNKFTFNNILNELRSCLSQRNYRRLGGHVKNHLRLKSWRWFFRGLRSYLRVKAYP